MSIEEIIAKYNVKLAYVEVKLEGVDELYHAGLLPAECGATAYQLGVDHGELFAEARLLRKLIAQLTDLKTKGER